MLQEHFGRISTSQVRSSSLQNRYRVQCWAVFTENSDWVRRADLFEKEGDDGNSCSRFDVWLMLAQQLVGGFGLHRPFVVELEATPFSFNLIVRTPLRNQKQFQTIGVRRIFEAVILQVGAVTSG